MLALHPDLVRMDLAVTGDTRPIAETLPLMRAGGVRSVSASGVLGDPLGATAAAGWTLLASLTADLVADVDVWSPAGAGG
jgi:creatinine amidohydrolase/Fe(II)-dependent formamide hydrolase-like protein